MPRGQWKRLADRFGRLYGDDIFISHSHADAGEYAVALASRLSKHLVAYVDRFSTEAGREISERVMNHLMRASMLVVIASPCAARPESQVGKEVEEFATTRRNIIAVDVDGSLQNCSWKNLVDGLSVPSEDRARLTPARPSVPVRRSIVRAFTYRTRAKKLWLASGAVVAGTFLVTALLGGAAWRASEAALDAEGRRSIAALNEQLATRGARRAMKQAYDASWAADEARKETEWQRRIASSQRIATVAEDAWQRHTATTDEVLLAVAESLRRAPTATAFRVAGEALPRRPRRVRRLAFHEGQALAFSPDGRWLVAASVDGKALFNLITGRKVWEGRACVPEDVRIARLRRSPTP